MDPAQPSTSTSVAGQVPGPTTYTIGGIKVEFPTKAYPSQLAMMNKVIQGLKHQQNCLLESPTGSGKSLALLCAALAWQRHEAALANEHNAAIDARAAQASADLKKQKQKRKTEETPKSGPPGSEKGKLESNGDGDATKTADMSTDSVMIDLTDDEDFQPTKRSKQSTSPQPDVDETFFLDDDDDSPSDFNDGTEYRTQENEESKEDAQNFVPPEKKLSVPRIYFGTRTHKQISQITRELRKTVYKNSRSVVLSSRDHTCINPMVEKLPNKNEACKELLDSNQMNGGCGFFNAAKKLGSFSAIQHYGIRPGFDLEDLVAAGREAKSCPYYASRYLMASADIIFCPYNYLIDPFVRKSMMIELENQVVIFDEGHNMEDASREAASFSINQDDMIQAMQDCEKIAHKNVEPFAHEQLAGMFSIMCSWMEDQKSKLKNVDYDNNGKCWTGTELIAAMELAGLDQKRLNELQEYYKIVVAQREKDIELAKERGGRGIERPSVSQSTHYLCDVIFRMFHQLNVKSGIHRDDFRLALLNSTVRSRKQGVFTVKQVLTFNFWCLNPAVAFSEIQSRVHCTILTSGTLSPMQSFQSELGTPFQIKLEASHVIDKNQVWASVIGSGPNKVSLNGSYRNTETLAYQDELGSLVLRVCQEIPFGILCFFPSYRMLENLVKRWEVTNTWSMISRIKIIFTEPRSGASDFQDVINHFYDSIANPMGGRTGALFLAVCRGKVSEGLDFADNNARAVICVGIPFPNYRDMQVEHKREYNERNRNRGLLSGGEWYEIQAFRALNQALGRCIRHRYDWGAILLVDDRYRSTPRYINSLSKWIRTSVRNFDTWDSCISSLSYFREQMSMRPVQEATPFGTDFDQSSYETQSLVPGTSAYLSSTTNFAGSTKATVLPNNHHPIQFDDDDDDENVDNGFPILRSQSPDESFVIGTGGNNHNNFLPPPAPKTTRGSGSVFRKQTNKRPFY